MPPARSSTSIYRPSRPNSLQTQSKLATLPLAAIDTEDRTFQVSAETDPADLATSIALIGLINPPQVIAAANRWRIVSGFRRICACCALGWERIQTWCLPPQTAMTTCACLAIADNALQRSLTLPEQIRASRLLFDHCGDAPEFASVARAVGLAPNLKLLRQMNALADAPPDLSRAVADGSVQFPMAMDLLKRPESEATALADLFQMLRPSLNRQRELLAFVDDISHRDELPVEQVVTAAVSQTDATNPDLDRSVRYARLRSALRSQRYPNLAKAEAERNKALRGIQLEPHMQLQPPANFEGRRYQLQLGFSSISELESQARRVSRLSKDPTVHKLLS
jgi:ParB family transcriptional regulator, chromosome partitioning protein